MNKALMQNLELGKWQVRDFCKHIEVWFNGTADGKDDLYRIITDSFSPSFSMVTGDGEVIGYAIFRSWLHEVYGRFPTRRIEVKDISGYATTAHVLLQFVEIQWTDNLRTERLSSAVFLLEEDRAVWSHLIEEWVL
ncbi:MAG: hypothetical protein LBE37_11170 [Sphingobacterium sp.]|jgi:hypothetical protein|nr:hypothetical protein [Sphingobacterium sp.]